MSKPLRVLVVGLGNMGRSHARAYANSAQFEIVGVVTRNPNSVPAEFQSFPHWSEYAAALAATQPDVVAISTYSETHADYAIKAMEAGAHVFVEKPLATNVVDAQRVADVAARLNRKVLVGYILRHHPLWQSFIAEARKLGGPYVFRVALNQPSSGAAWETHKALMETLSPIVDAGVHYVDVMYQIVDASPTEVRGMGLRLSNDIAPTMYNYGQFQVLFEDTSIGWFEAGWGPMISHNAETIFDILSPGGSVSIIEENGTRHVTVSPVGSDSPQRLVCRTQPNRDDLCALQQSYLHHAITTDLDLTPNLKSAISSLDVCLAADDSVREGRSITVL
ncbi:putative dehydrogenase [Devosia sp. 2618]